MNARIEITPVTENDYRRLFEIETDCFAVPWSLASIAAYASVPGTILLAARLPDEGGRIAGYIGLRAVLDEGEIGNLAVEPQSRRAGIGKALLLSVLEFAVKANLRAIFLEVRPSNRAASALYLACGFREYGQRKGYYADTGESALLYTWENKAYSPENE